MKITIEFNLENERQDFEYASRGVALYSALQDMNELLRNKCKYGPLSEDQQKFADELRHEFLQILEDRGVSDFF